MKLGPCDMLFGMYTASSSELNNQSYDQIVKMGSQSLRQAQVILRFVTKATVV